MKVKQFLVDSDLDDNDSSDPIDFGSDEEIDEDAAFTAEDYLKYGDIGVKRKREFDVDDDYSDDESGEFTNITDLLGDNDEMDDDDHEIDPKNHKNLLKSIKSIHSDAPPRKKFKKQQSEIYQEAEYNIRPTLGKVEMEDLMPSLDDSKSYGELKKKLEKLNEKKNSTDKPLSAPVKDRLSRKAAYIKANQDISKWMDTVQYNRRADQLRFPMNVPRVPFASSKSISNDFKPKTSLESSIASILETSGINERNIKELEGLAEKQLTEEEILQRRGELAKMRNLMLYKEQKDKHRKKIKSKKFRKILRKEKERGKLSLEELEVIDPEKYQKLLEEREIERIKERITLKHSNTSKWAKRTVKLKDLSSRKAVQDQIYKGEELRRKMNTIHDSDSESSDSNSDDDDIDIEAEYDHLVNDSKEKGIHALKFMKRAAQKQKDEFLESLKEKDENESSDDDNTGRMKFGPSSIDTKLQKAQELKEKQIKLKENQQKNKKSQKTKKQTVPQSNPDDQVNKSTKNPWMNLKNGSSVTKKAKELEKKQSKLSSKLEQIDTELNVDDVLSISDEKLEANNLLSNQKQIIEEAFAGLDVYKEFEKEKESIDNSDTEDLNVKELPGWGSWAGDGVKMSAKQKRNLAWKKKQKKLQLEARKAKRKDAKLKNVIINEKRDKKFDTYQVGRLPIEFGNKRQYERTLSQPLGPEWNTLNTHSILTKPSVITKPGLVINPIEVQMVKRKRTQKQQRKPL